MTGAEFAKALHNAVTEVASAYGCVLQVLLTENVALRAKVAQLEAAERARQEINKPAPPEPPK